MAYALSLSNGTQVNYSVLKLSNGDSYNVVEYGSNAAELLVGFEAESDLWFAGDSPWGTLLAGERTIKLNHFDDDDVCESVIVNLAHVVSLSTYSED